jgi:predicted nucleotidyltransferase/biotin operon repressor
MEHVFEEVLASKARISLLRRLYEDPSPKSGRQLARELGCSHTHAINHLRSLEDLGIIIRHRVGPANTYTFNGKSYLVKNVITPLFEAEDNYLREVASRFSDGLHEDLVRIILFGSVAKGTANPRSDLDLALVVKDECDIDHIELEAAGIAAEAMVEFGRPVDALVFREKDFKSKVRQGKGMWNDIEGVGIDLLERTA